MHYRIADQTELFRLTLVLKTGVKTKLLLYFISLLPLENFFMQIRSKTKIRSKNQV